VKLWDTEKWQPVPHPEGARPDKTGSVKFVLSVAWSPDGKLLACGSMDGTIAVYDAIRMKFKFEY
jgi:WD repeat-containing protein 61